MADGERASRRASVVVGGQLIGTLAGYEVRQFDGGGAVTLRLLVDGTHASVAHVAAEMARHVRPLPVVSYRHATPEPEPAQTPAGLDLLGPPITPEEDVADLIKRLVEHARRSAIAVDVAERCGGIDGAHHKQWVIDQMLRAILGDEGYAEWRERVDSDEDYSRWSEGVAP